MGIVSRVVDLRRPRPLVAASILVSLLGTSFPSFASAAAGVTLNLRVERAPVVLFKGAPVSAPELIEAMSRINVGRTDFSMKQTQPSYSFSVVGNVDSRYRIDPASLRLNAPATITVLVRVRYPKLSEAQYRALRDTEDYRLVYGLIRGIVQHEELHVQGFVRYARKLKKILAAPPLDKAYRAKAADVARASKALAANLEQRVSNALAAARKENAAQQRAIDNAGNITEITFNFNDSVEGEVPLPIIFRTKNLFRASFSIPPNHPRPPEPRLVY